MTREEILKKFEIDKYGIIQSPGKFESHMLYVPYFWDMVLEGFYDEELFDEYDRPVSFIKIREEDLEEFPELESIYGIALWEDDYGFVNSIEFKTEKEYREAIKELESIEPEEY